MINFLKWLVNRIYCKMDFHETYSIAEDKDFTFTDEETLEILSGSHAQIKEHFKQLTAIRCRHCNYVYTGKK